MFRPMRMPLVRDRMTAHRVPLLRHAVMALLVIAACLGGWTPSRAAAVQLPLTVYDQSNGLTSLSVIRMIQDREGYLWVGTEKGLYRFDGVGLQRRSIRRTASRPRR